MRFTEYLKRNEIDEAAAARALSVSQSAVRKWRYGERMPRPQMIERICVWSDNAVTPSDWYETAKAAV